MHAKEKVDEDEKQQQTTAKFFKKLRMIRGYLINAEWF